MPRSMHPILYLPFDASANDKSDYANNTTVSGASLTTNQYLHQNKAYSFNGANNKITVGNINLNAQSIEIHQKLNALTNYLFDFNGGTTYVWSNAGTLTGTGFTSPLYYINGLSSSTTKINLWQNIIVTTGTNILCSNITIGNVGANWYDGTISLIKLHSIQLTPTQVKYQYDRTKRNIGRGI